MTDELSFECTVEKVKLYDPETGYSIIIIDATDEDGNPVTAVGVVPNVTEGDTLEIKGSWKTHPRFGAQVQINSAIKIIPHTAVGLIKYLSSGYIRGIGPSLAEKIVNYFGDSTTEMLDTSPQLLLGLQGIGKAKYERIVEDWNKNRSIEKTMVFLQSYGITPGLAYKLHAEYGDDTISKVQSNPFELAGKVWGVGFQTADRIGQAMNIAADSPFRIEAGISYVLKQATRNGHMMLPRPKLLAAACNELKVQETLVDKGIGRLVLQGDCIEDHLAGQANIYLDSSYASEIGVAQQLHRIMSSDMSPFKMKRDQIIADLKVSGKDLGLTETQILAIQNAANNKVSILCGSPGTGKTTCLKALVDICHKSWISVELASPTASAAKRLSEATRADAQTIHRLLGTNPGESQFLHNEENPLQMDLLIIDESSMLDTSIMHSLLKAVPISAHILFVGDPDQLPSVGAGNILRDMINSGVICVTKLTAIFRQAAGSLIIENAFRINRGELPDISNKPDSDWFFLQVENPEEACNQVVDLVASRIPKRYGFKPSTDIQVFAPMKRGPVGIIELNKRLREALNTPTHSALEVRYGEKIFRVNDKVMQASNNYNLGVLNGDIGIVSNVLQEDNQLAVDYDGHIVVYEQDDLDELQLAYAKSIHKAQGSEVPCAIVVIHEAHWVMLKRNLLFTGVTRGKKLIVVVGTLKALKRAVQNNSVDDRYTGLSYRLRSFMAET